MTVEEMVAEALTHGSLYRAVTPGQRSLTVEGINLPVIRWQAAVFTLLYADADPQLPPRARHLIPKIREALTSRTEGEERA